MRLPVLTVLLALAAPGAAHADTLLAPATGASHLAIAGGAAAWAAPAAGGRFKLVIRDAGGSVRDAPVPTFQDAPDLALGSDALTQQQLVAVYPRCGRAGCDLYSYPLRGGAEKLVPGASSHGYSEKAPSIASGRIAFTRSGGRRNGTFVLMPSGKLYRVDTRIARETAVSVSRVSFLAGDTVSIAQLDGHNKRRITHARGIFSLVMTRYKVGWLQRASAAVVARQTDRINPSATTFTIRTGKRMLPATTNSAAADASNITTYLDAEGVKRLDPPIF